MSQDKIRLQFVARNKATEEGVGKMKWRIDCFDKNQTRQESNKIFLSEVPKEERSGWHSFEPARNPTGQQLRLQRWLAGSILPAQSTGLTDLPGCRLAGRHVKNHTTDLTRN